MVLIGQKGNIQMKKNGGFTILELMVVVAVIAIIAAIAIPHHVLKPLREAQGVVEKAYPGSSVISMINLGGGLAPFSTTWYGSDRPDINSKTVKLIAKVTGGGVAVVLQKKGEEKKDLAVVKDGKIVATGVAPDVNQAVLDSIILVSDSPPTTTK